MCEKNNVIWINPIFQEDLLIHGDSIYDIVDKQDHPTLHVHLNDKEEPTSPSDNLPKSTKNKKQIFLCRINVSRNARRQMRFGDQKVILVRGHFYSELPLCSRDEPVREKSGEILDEKYILVNISGVRCLVHAACDAWEPGDRGAGRHQCVHHRAQPRHEDHWGRRQVSAWRSTFTCCFYLPAM